MEFEVEIRCHFENDAEAFGCLPFLKSSLNRKCDWSTTIYGLQLFQAGQLLRTARVAIDDATRYYLGWKGPDTGRFANIRQERDEEITAATTGSEILNSLGGQLTAPDIQAVIRELERLGYPAFMAFKDGTDFTGYDSSLDIKLKLMYCEQLRWPCMVEIEKTAYTREEAGRCEKELEEISRLYGLSDRMVKEEPPTLLYQALFPTREIKQ